MVKAAPAEIDAGSSMALKVRVACPSACDLRGQTIKIIAQDAVIAKEIELTGFDGTGNETEEFEVKAPAEPGEYTWTAVFPAEKARALHPESSAPFSFVAKPHTVSIRVWDIASAVTVGDEFVARVEVGCSAGCKLSDKKIEVYDHEGTQVATGTLVEAPGQAAAALSVAEVTLKAPGKEGRFGWTVKFPEPGLELPHAEASRTFAFGVARQPDHVVTIEAVEKDTNAPVRDAHVMLRPALYRGAAYVTRTDEGGVAKVSVPKGCYQAYVRADGKDAFLHAVEIDSDVTFKMELAVVDREWWEFK